MPKYTLESGVVFPFASNSFVDPEKSTKNLVLHESETILV